MVREPLRKPLGSKSLPSGTGVYLTLSLSHWLPDREWSSRDQPTRSTFDFHKSDG